MSEFKSFEAVKESKMTTKPRGLYRESDKWVMVDYGERQESLPKEEYEKASFEPIAEMLPSKADYDRAKVTIASTRA
jgi:hypothetical protein